MDRPVDPATPFREVYQHFLSILAKHGHKERTRLKYMYDYQRFKRWLALGIVRRRFRRESSIRGTYSLVPNRQGARHRRMGVADKRNVPGVRGSTRFVRVSMPVNVSPRKTGSPPAARRCAMGMRRARSSRWRSSVALISSYLVPAAVLE